MGKLIKYEIKGTYKVILALLATVLIAFTIMYTSIITERIIFLTFISPIILYAANLISFFYIVGSFKKELYEDRGYLTFSLPLTGNEIVGAKLIVAVLWFVVLWGVTILYNVFMLSFVFKSVLNIDILEDIKEVLYLIQDIDIRLLIGFVLVILITLLIPLLLIYFSMAISRVASRKKIVGKSWFIIAIIIGIIIIIVGALVTELLPIFIDLDTWRLVSVNEISFIDENPDVLTYGIDETGYYNIMDVLFKLIIGTLLFVSTGYLIEKKIDI